MSRRILFEKRIRSIARTPAHRPSELPKPCPQATAVHAFGGLRKIAPVGMITNDDFVRIVLTCRSRQGHSIKTERDALEFVLDRARGRERPSGPIPTP